MKSKLRPRRLICSHLNADFDAFASAMAAAKLHPGAVVVMPGSVERGLRDFFSDGGVETVEMEVVRLRDLDLSGVEELIIVDTRQPHRLGPLAALLDRPGIKITIYDHHPEGGEDIHGHEELIRPYGSNTTMMVELLVEKGLAISPLEATILAIGIYEDTGSFTFASTTPNDLEAAATLVRLGADVKRVGEVVRRRFTPSHLELLQDLRRSAVVYRFRHIRTTVAKGSVAEYIEDVSMVAGEMMDMDSIPALFVLVFMEGQVVVVGRSRDQRVDVAHILREIGGGGHPYAASATLRGITLAEAEEKLITALRKVLGQDRCSAEIMTTPVIHVSPSTPLFEVHDQLTRFGITVLPVVEDGRPIGLISRRTVEKALYHGLGRLPVSEYMTTDFSTVCADDPLTKVEEIIIGNRQRFVPVVDGDGRICGVISRTDLLQLLASDETRHPEPLLGQMEHRRDVSRLLNSRVDGSILELLRKVGEVARSMQMEAYCVGGFVRDLLLRVENTDIDIVVEGNGIALAHALAKRMGGRVREHKKFGTAVVILPDGFKLDVATARWEYYEYPAAMPTVALSSIKLDLFRRDFTINTLAISLDPDRFGLLIDFFGGQRDIKDRVIRVLHSLSFVEDPTRVFRAVRFEQRYGFRIGKHTLRLIDNAKELDLFQRLSGHRLFNEVRLILSENDPRPALDRLHGLGLMNAICPGLQYTPEIRKLMGRIYDALAWYRLTFPRTGGGRIIEPWLPYLLGLLWGLKAKRTLECAERLSMKKRDRDIVIQAMERGPEVVRQLSDTPSIPPSQLNRLLRDLSPEILIFLIALVGSPGAKGEIVRFMTEIQDKKPLITGKDLRSLGLPPGPIYAAILERVHNAYLDGEVQDRDEALKLCRRLVDETQNANHCIPPP